MENQVQGVRNDKFSLEDRQALDRLKNEGSIYYGWPFGLSVGGLTYMGAKKYFPQFPALGRFSIAVSFAVVGNFIGRMYYMFTSLPRLKAELPENSQLRQYLEQVYDSNKLRNNTSQTRPSYVNQSSNQDFPQVSSPPSSAETVDVMQSIDLSSNITPSDEPDKRKPQFRSYEELRNIHRVKQNQAVTSSQSGNQWPSIPADETLSNQYNEGSSIPDKKIRYNKYGDPILE